VKKYQAPSNDPCTGNPKCLGITNVPLLNNIRRKLIDPSTPSSATSKTALDGSKMDLVFSDEFNTDGRTFWPGDDPYFTAVNIWYGVTQDLEVSRVLRSCRLARLIVLVVV